MKEPVLKASEVGRFVYCSVAWHLERQGCQPESAAGEKGLEHHADLGSKIDDLLEAEQTSERQSHIGYGLIFAAVIVLIVLLCCQLRT